MSSGCVRICVFGARRALALGTLVGMRGIVEYDSFGHLAAPRSTRLHFSCTTMNPYRHKVATSFRRLFDCACRFRASGFLGCTNVLFDDDSLEGAHVAFIGMCGAVLH